MNRHERRAATKTKVAGTYCVKPEHYSRTSANGLIQVDVVFGMVRPPAGEREVREGFRDLAASLRDMADEVERMNDNAPVFSGGGDA